MKNEKIRELTTQEIQEYIAEEKLNLTKMRLTHSVSPLDNPMKLRNTKRLIARLNTELRNRQLNEVKDGE